MALCPSLEQETWAPACTFKWSGIVSWESGTIVESIDSYRTLKNHVPLWFAWLSNSEGTHSQRCLRSLWAACLLRAAMRVRCGWWFPSLLVVGGVAGSAPFLSPVGRQQHSHEWLRLVTRLCAHRHPALWIISLLSWKATAAAQGLPPGPADPVLCWSVAPPLGVPFPASPLMNSHGRVSPAHPFWTSCLLS